MTYSIGFFDTSFNIYENGNSGYNYFLIDCSNGNININFNNQWYDGDTFKIKRTDNSLNTLTLTAYVGSTINYMDEINLSKNKVCECVMYNNNWMSSIFNCE